MVERRKPRPRDPRQLAKLIGDIATGRTEDRIKDERDPNAVALGKKGGAARARKTTPERRVGVARKAAETRWKVSVDD